MLWLALQLAAATIVLFMTRALLSLAAPAAVVDAGGKLPPQNEQDEDWQDATTPPALMSPVE